MTGCSENSIEPEYDRPEAYGKQPVFVYLTEKGVQRHRYTATVFGVEVVAKGPTTENAVRVVMNVLKKHKVPAPKKQKPEIIALKDWRELEKVWKQRFLPL